MPIEDPRFTREELIALGLVKDEGAETPPATPPAAAPAPPTVDPSVAEALKTLAALQARAAAPVQPVPPPTPKPSVDDLLAEGKIDEALVRAREEVRDELGNITAQQSAALSSVSKELFRQRMGEDFSVWYPLIQIELQKNGVPESALTTADAWDRALAHTKAQNIDIILQKEREKWAQEARSSVLPGSRGGPSFGGAAVPDGMTPDDMELARALRISPVDYSRNKRILERYVDHRGDVDNAPVINRDLTNRDEFGELKIKPGEF